MKRGLLFFLMAWLMFASHSFAADYSQLQESTTPNYTQHFFYGKKVKLVGNLSASGVSGFESQRPAFLSRWKGIYTENIKTGATFTQDKYDVFNVMETEATDDFYQREGYGLLPINETIIKQFLQDYVNADQRQRDGIWGKLQNYNNFNSYGFYTVEDEAYYLVSQLVAMAGGKWVENQVSSNDLTNMSEVKGTTNFVLSPYPEINSAQIINDQLEVDFSAYGYTKRDIILTLTNGSDSKDYTYSNITQPTFQTTLTKAISDFNQLGTENLKVILNDGFWRYAEKEVTVNRPPTDNAIKFALWKGNASKTLTQDMVNHKAGGFVLHSYEYNPEIEVVWDGTYGHNSSVGFNKPAKISTHSVIDFDLHQYRMNYTTETLTMENISEVSSPLIFYIMDSNGKRLNRYQVNQGEKISVPIQLGNKIHFPTPLEDEGYWDNAELSVYGDPATIKNITSEQRKIFDNLIEVAKDN